MNIKTFMIDFLAITLCWVMSLLAVIAGDFSVLSSALFINLVMLYYIIKISASLGGKEK